MKTIRLYCTVSSALHIYSVSKSRNREISTAGLYIALLSFETGEVFNSLLTSATELNGKCSLFAFFTTFSYINNILEDFFSRKSIMPLYVRRIEPMNVSRKKIVFSEAANLTENNLVHSKEESANRTLANILRQLANLGEHAVNIFDGLENESDALQKRTQDLNMRIVTVEETLKVCS